MIALEPFRLARLTEKPGDIALNEDGQKFILRVVSAKLITMEPYEGKRKPIHFVYTGKIPDEA